MGRKTTVITFKLCIDYKEVPNVLMKIIVGNAYTIINNNLSQGGKKNVIFQIQLLEFPIKLHISFCKVFDKFREKLLFFLGIFTYFKWFYFIGFHLKFCKVGSVALL